ncbi:hypothetical protein CDD82_762 [Ophiocordyceps australis]|uniref:Amine oxidase domain-containing protein n=1 Tax=Ophiocordyceps australis TaxID=1399860 RepID=A0A2C5ZTW0_9HYPO|nr:hypothetical protein CDD82_762 [Ophiocordyceps australis]
MEPPSDDTKKRHIAIIGGGAAGMSCAATLANHPDRFKVTLLERADVVGGQATSIALDKQRHGASWMNNGVQGGSRIFKHTFNFFREQGFPPHEVQLQVAFGKGEDGFWTNVFPTKLVERYAADIRKFGYFLRLIKWTMPILGLVPISIMLRVFFFSKDFGDKMVYPLIALFLGTGNQTPNVPSAIVERLFDDANMKLWDYDAVTLLPNLPTMYTFDHLDAFYKSWKSNLEAKGVIVRTETEVSQVVSRCNEGGVTLRITDLAWDRSTDETFDDMVLCTLADDSLRILGKQASWREKMVLGGAAFFDDLTVTHSDSKYFEQHYETRFKQELCAEPSSDQQKKQVAFAQGQGGAADGFKPMYYTFSYQRDPRLIEMSFNCSNYQHQLKQANADSDRALEPVYQTIFLNKKLEAMWTLDSIDENKVIKKNWWHQLGHRWQHYLRVVPGMMFLHGRQHTYFAGSWTLVNMHELACVSGIAAAYHIGADYVKVDDFAQDFFSKYLLLSHGMVFSRQEKKRRRTRT